MVWLCPDVSVPCGPPSASRGSGHFAILSGMMCVWYRQTTSSCQKSNPTVYKIRISKMFFLQSLFILQESKVRFDFEGWILTFKVKFVYNSTSRLIDRKESKVIFDFKGCILIPLNKREERKSPLQARFDFEDCITREESESHLHFEGHLSTLMFKFVYDSKASQTSKSLLETRARFDFEGHLLILTFKFVYDPNASYIFSQQDLLSRSMMSRDVPPLSVCINQFKNTFSDFHLSCIDQTSKATLKTIQVKSNSKINISLVNKIFWRMTKEFFIFGIMLSSRSFVDCILTSFFPLFFDSRNRLNIHYITVGRSSDFDFAMEIVPPYISHKSQAGIIHMTNQMPQADHTHMQHASLPVTIPETSSSESTLSIL